MNRPASGIPGSALVALYHRRIVPQSALGNLVAAFDAITELTFLDPLESCRDACAFDLAPAFLRQRHCLHLHSIDAGQATYALLVQRDWVAIIRGDTILLV
ncbi:hypothetical protein MBENS4_0493 [Novosphingobium sp. MBES04]|nr:hypothetical protein [uncultured Croceicoccus sp.]GAM03494.1 hypothetical protein MBENS4_0493 [Novosphingobium sp. MBES04]